MFSWHFGRAGNLPAITFRDELRSADRDHIRDIIAASGFFSTAEIDVAVELAEDRLVKGLASGYYFLFADCDGIPLGYTCYGPIACTVGSFDLYWIAVHPEHRHKGLGRKLLVKTEQAVAGMGGRAVYIETSNRELYVPTRKFYETCGYQQQAVLPEFYGPGDDKVIFHKRLV